MHTVFMYHFITAITLLPVYTLQIYFIADELIFFLLISALLHNILNYSHFENNLGYQFLYLF